MRRFRLTVPALVSSTLRVSLPSSAGLLIGALALAVWVAGCSGSSAPTPPGTPADSAIPDAPALEFLGMVELPPGTQAGGVPLGGLSALAHDPETGDWLALSDDRGQRGPARFHRLRLDVDGSGWREGGVAVVSSHRLHDASGTPFRPGSVDPEGLVRTDTGLLLIASEGDAAAGLPPFVGEFTGAVDDEASRVRRYFEVPRRYLPRQERPGRWRGARPNLALEALTLAPGGTLWAGMEGPLAQDGPGPAPGTSARVRLLRYDLASGRVAGETLYPLDPVPVPARPEGAFAVNGLVELLAVDDDHLLALERSFVVGHGHFLRLYRTRVTDAADSSSWDALPRPDDEGAPTVLGKELVLDLSDLGQELFNIEGMAWGPSLADGRRLLVLVSDDNFSPDQRTQFFAFAAHPERLVTAPVPAAPLTPIAAVQGAGHVSPRVGRRVSVEGVVTAVTRPGSRGGPPGGESGFWLQDATGDGDPATSEALFVATPNAASMAAATPPPTLAPGDRVRARGWVAELGRRGGLPVTALLLEAGGLKRLASGRDLPPAVRVGRAEAGGDGVCPPPSPDDDGLTVFEPETDALDFWESLEGMRVALAAPRVTGPTSRYGEIFVMAEGCGRGPWTVHGGLLLRSGTVHPERVALTSRLVDGRAPELAVGSRFSASVEGILSYDFSNYRILVFTWPVATPAPWSPETTSLGTPRDGTDGGWTVGTLNLENLSAVDRAEKFTRLAESVVTGLGSPDVVALQEVQDDSGPEDDGMVTSAATLTRFVSAVREAGGPLYEARWVDPENNADGGRPGGNIRNALLFDPSRVAFRDRGSANPETAAGWVVEGARASLDTSPGRLFPRDPAFADSRKPLVAELEVGGEPLFVVVNHFASKGGDDALAGPTQPPQRDSDDQRRRQAELVAEFVGTLLAVDPEARVVVLGDLNDFPWRDTLAPLGDAGLVNLMDRLPEADRYTYVYQGNASVLDHILVSPALAASATVDAVHRHADLPDAEKPSDHDPVVARFGAAPSGAAPSGAGSAP